jgi:hypothetical protein
MLVVPACVRSRRQRELSSQAGSGEIIAET